MSKEVVLCLNGVEFTPPGSSEAVCWPWEQTRTPLGSITILDADGNDQRFGGECVGWYIGETNGKVAQRLRLRKLRGCPASGRKIVIDPKTFGRASWWLPIGFALVGVVLLILEWMGLTGTKSGAVGLAIISFITAALMAGGRLSSNVAAMTITEDGMDVRLHDGRAMFIRWTEIQSERGGEIRTVNGLVLRPTWSPQLRDAVVEYGLVRRRSMGRYRRKLNFWFWPGAVAMVGGCVGALQLISGAFSIGPYDPVLKVGLLLLPLVGMWPVLLRWKFCIDGMFSPPVRFSRCSTAAGWTGHRAPGGDSAGIVEAR